MPRLSLMLRIALVGAVLGFGTAAARHSWNRQDYPFAYSFFPVVSEESIREEEHARPVETALPSAVRVPILVYHLVRPHDPGDSAAVRAFDVRPDVFEQQLQYLASHGYTSITPDDLVHILRDGAPLPLKPVVLTFDDGWEMQYTYAFPLLVKYHFTATFYIFTNAIDHRHFLTWQKVRALDAAGMTIGGHTRSHPYVSRIADWRVLRDEIAGSKEVLERHLGHPVTAFASPFGLSNERIVALAKEAGFTSLRTMDHGQYHTAADLFALTSLRVTEDLDRFITLMQ